MLMVRISYLCIAPHNLTPNSETAMVVPSMEGLLYGIYWPTPTCVCCIQEMNERIRGMVGEYCISFSSQSFYTRC